MPLRPWTPLEEVTALAGSGRGISYTWNGMVRHSTLDSLTKSLAWLILSNASTTDTSIAYCSVTLCEAVVWRR